jgi:hypothetical protein
MHKQKTVTVNIINRNYPPNTGVTAESAAELAAYLVANGLKVNIIYVDAGHQKSMARRNPPGTSYPIKTLNFGRHVALQLLGNLYESFRLLRKSRSLRPDVTICMTEPPLLNIIAAFFFKKSERWILWSMDLFPEGFSAGNIISENSRLYRFVDGAVRKNKPWHVISLGDHQIAYLKQKFGNNTTFTKLPCGIYTDNSTHEQVPAWATDRSKTILGYCGNIGQAHSDDFIMSVINSMNPDKFKLILALYGLKAKRVLDFAKGKPGVETVAFVERAELKYIDIHLSSLKREWVNISVPSKTVSSVCSGSAFLYHGCEESDNWSLLKEAGWRLPAENGNFVGFLPAFFADVDHTIHQKKIAASRLFTHLRKLKEDAFHDIHQRIMEICSSR